MSQLDRTSTLGPAVFIGLSIYALATYSPPEVVFANPADTLPPAALAASDRIDTPQTTVGAPRPLPPEKQLRITHPDAVNRPLPSAADERSAALAPPPHITALFSMIPFAPQVVVDGVALPRIVSLFPVTPATSPPQPPAAPRLANAPSSPRAALPRRRVAGDFVNLRSAPGVAAPSLALFNRGDLAIVLDADGRWRRVYMPNSSPPMTGWMFESYLAPIQ